MKLAEKLNKLFEKDEHQDMYSKLMGHFKRNASSMGGHSKEYFAALKKINPKDMTDKNKSLIKELWSMYGEKLSEELFENKKELVRGGDRLTANKTAKFGNNVKMVAVDNGKTIALHLKYTDGDKLVELPKTKSSIDDFEFELKKNTILPMVGGKLQITNESVISNKLLDQANKLNVKAAQQGDKVFKHGGKQYSMRFNLRQGHWEVRQEGSDEVIGRYTNKIFNKAKKDFIDYLEN